MQLSSNTYLYVTVSSATNDSVWSGTVLNGMSQLGCESQILAALVHARVASPFAGTPGTMVGRPSAPMAMVASNFWAPDWSWMVTRILCSRALLTLPAS